jgi:hypothetical protein
LNPSSIIRHRLLNRSGRWLCLLALSLIWLADNLLLESLQRSNILDAETLAFAAQFERVSNYIFALLTLAMAVIILRPFPRLFIPMASVYSAFTVVQVFVNVTSLVFTAHVKTGIGLTVLYDVAGIYILSVLVFMMVYLLIDVSTPGGAFIWPSRAGEKAPEPHLIDYLFVSLNVNSTFGPTTEAVMSRSCKLVMALQALLSVLMLTVLISRAIGATN